MAKNIIIEKDMQELAGVNISYGELSLPVIYRYKNSIVIGSYTNDQLSWLKSMGATIRESDWGHHFPCMRYTKIMESRLHLWRNEEAIKARQELLGDGWTYASGDPNHCAEAGDEIVTVSGMKGRCMKGGTTISFQDYEKGYNFTTGGYFMKSEDYYRHDLKSWQESLKELVKHHLDGKAYKAGDFYAWTMRKSFNHHFDDISRAMDCGSEADVIAAICNHLKDDQELCEAVSKVSWLEDDLHIIDQYRNDYTCFFNHPGFDLRLFVTVMGRIYRLYYESRDAGEGYQKAVSRGDEILKDKKVTPLIFDYQELTHDFISSDREAAAFGQAYDIFETNFNNKRN